MSWDAVLLRVKGGVRPMEEIEDGDYLPLGSRGDVVAAIRAAFPAGKWEAGSQLLFTDGDLSIEFAPSGKGEVDSVVVEVRGEGDPITPLMELASRNGWVVLDASTSELIDPDEPSDEGYGGYRRLVRGEGKAPRRKRGRK
jgi:hypothetical protein